MKNLFLFFSVFLILTATAFGKTKEPNLKLDAETSQQSWDYHLNSYPTKKIDDAYWVTQKRPPSFRYLHAMLVAAFFSERADQLQSARLWLANYPCENILACTEEQSFLDIAMKSYILILKKKELNQLRKIQMDVDKRVLKFKSQIPVEKGLCADRSDRKAWFELAYEIYCPNHRTLTAQLDSGHKTTQSLLKLLERQSQQMIMSSNRVLDFGHDGDIDCITPWTVQLKCQTNKEVAYKLNCSRASDTTKVSCSEEKK